MPSSWRASYYRTSAQAVIDLVLEGPRQQVVAVEIKRSLAPTLSKGYHLEFEDVGATCGVVVTPDGERFPLAKNIEAIPLTKTRCSRSSTRGSKSSMPARSPCGRTSSSGRIPSRTRAFPQRTCIRNPALIPFGVRLPRGGPHIHWPNRSRWNSGASSNG